MKYEQISSQLFIKNRKKFADRMKEGSIAVFNSNDIYPISADSTMPFQQHRDIFYLSGVDQEESILLLFPSAIKEKHREARYSKKSIDWNACSTCDSHRLRHSISSELQSYM